MKTNLFQILEQLHWDIHKAKYCSADVRPDTPIELADDQKVIRTGVIYLVSQKEAHSFLSNAIIQPGAYLMVSDVEEPGCIADLPFCDGITVVEFRCHLSSMYNQLVKAMNRHFRNSNIELPAAESSRQDQLLTFWKQIRSKTLQGTVEIKEHLRHICSDFKPYIRLIVIVHDESSDKVNWSMVLEELQSALNNNNLFFCANEADGQIIGFQFFTHQNFGALENQDAILQILIRYQLHMMVSNSTRDYSKLNTLYSLTRRAGLVATRLNLQEDQRIYHYERYSMYQIIDLCTQRYMSLFNHSDIIYLVHPIVVHLTRYDEKNRTNLRDVLFYYLQNSQDIKHTAEVLYMHRNTVSNKINQIRNICHVNFEDGGLCQRLLFSCQVMLYYERVLQQRLMRNEELREY